MSIDRFLGALVIKGEQKASAQFLETTLQGAYLSIAEATRVEVLQLLKKGDPCPLGIGDEPGSDLVPEALERVWPAAPVMGSPTLFILLVSPFGQGEGLGLHLRLW